MINCARFKNKKKAENQQISSTITFDTGCLPYTWVVIYSETNFCVICFWEKKCSNCVDALANLFNGIEEREDI